MRILLTNDDGILAPGLAALYRAVAEIGEIHVVAPDAPQSATGHGITLEGPLATRRVHVANRFWGVSVAGRPADCVKLGMRELVEGPVDLVLSGINPGANAGINVLYSGTVAAAAEGAMLGAAAVAFSMETGGELDFDRAAGHCREVLDVLLAGGLAAGELVSVNVPRLDGDGPRGVRVCRQSVAAVREEYDSRIDEHGRVCYRLTDEYDFDDSPADTDVVALGAGYVAVTPLHVDLTDTARLGPLSGLSWADGVD